MLILMAGLPGTGKTFMAQRLASHLDATILSKDVARHALLSPDLVEYSTAQDDFVIDLLLKTAEYIWSKLPEKVVILDGRTFSRAPQRRHVIEFAKRSSQEWRIIECVCSEQTAIQRLAVQDPNHPAANRTPVLYDEVKARWESIEEAHIQVTTDREISMDKVLHGLGIKPLG